MIARRWDFRTSDIRGLVPATVHNSLHSDQTSRKQGQMGGESLQLGRLEWVYRRQTVPPGLEAQ